MRIDADAHVDETEATWSYLAEAEEQFRPITVDPGMSITPGDARPPSPVDHRRPPAAPPLA